MQSKTSFYKTLLRSDWRHHWPIAFSYTLFWVIALPLSLWQDTNWESNEMTMAQRIAESMAEQGRTVILCVVFGIIAAMAVWSYLMKSASVQFMHALPATRRTQYIAHFLSGFSLLTAGHIVNFFAVIAVMAARGALLWDMALFWLLIAELTALFFFALATVCCIITGWLLAAPVLYGGLNCVVIVFAALVQTLAGQCNYWGYAYSDFPGFVYWLTPVYRMAENYGGSYNAALDRMVTEPLALSTAAVYGAAGAVLAVCAYLLYRKRHSETAGDAVAFRWLYPIVRWVIAVCGGLGLGLFVVSLFLGEENLVKSTVCICLFGVICYVAVEMLLRKSYKVFCRRVLLGCAALCAVFIALSAVLSADLFGYESRIPKENDVASVHMDSSAQLFGSELTEPADIQQVLAIHSALAAMKTTEWEEADQYITLDYALKNGTALHRSYWVAIEPQSSLHVMLNDLYNTPAVRQQNIFPGYEKGGEENVLGGYVSIYTDAPYGAEGTIYDYDMSGVRTYTLTKEQARALYVSLGQEAAETGSADVLTEVGDYCEIEFEMEKDAENYFDYVDVRTNWCPKTLQLLIDYGMIAAKG